MQSAHPETASLRERKREGGARETLAGRQTAAQGNKRMQSKARSQPQGSVPGAQRARAVSLSRLSMGPIETGTALQNMLTKALPSSSDACPKHSRHLHRGSDRDHGEAAPITHGHNLLLQGQDATQFSLVPV